MIPREHQVQLDELGYVGSSPFYAQREAFVDISEW